MAAVDDVLLLRRNLAERFAVAPVAFTSDGRVIGFVGPVDLGIDIGGFATIDLPSGASLAVQVRELRIVDHVGPSVDVDVSDVVAGASHATVRPSFRSLSGSAAVLAEISPAGVRGVTSTTPFNELRIRPSSHDEVTMLIDGLLSRDTPSITMGTIVGGGAPARLRSTGFSRHTFMCGQSGSGKTYTTGVLFERLLAHTSLPIVVLDPNSDHVHLGTLRDPADPSPASQRYRVVAPSIAVARARGSGGTHTLCADFSDLGLEVQARLLRLDAIADLDAYAVLRRVTDQLGDQYSVIDVAALARRDPATNSLATRIDNLELADWSLWRRDGETSIASIDMRDAPCVVVDLGSLPRPEERTTVALALLGRRWASRDQRRSTLIAVDEAHNVFPAATHDPLQQAAADLGALIAGEGRKFGLHLLVATQRPGKVHPNVVSQCDNLVLMRMNGAADIEDMASLFSHVPAPLLRRALTFGLGQALFAGPISPLPMFARIGARLTPEGGGDVPTSWATAD